jgi:hypothetical protein
MTTPNPAARRRALLRDPGMSGARPVSGRRAPSAGLDDAVGLDACYETEGRSAPAKPGA